MILTYFHYQARVIAPVTDGGSVKFDTGKSDQELAIIVNQLCETNHIIFIPPEAQLLLFKKKCML